MPHMTLTRLLPRLSISHKSRVCPPPVNSGLQSRLLEVRSWAKQGYSGTRLDQINQLLQHSEQICGDLANNPLQFTPELTHVVVNVNFSRLQNNYMICSLAKQDASTSLQIITLDTWSVLGASTHSISHILHATEKKRFVCQEKPQGLRDEQMPHNRWELHMFASTRNSGKWQKCI